MVFPGYLALTSQEFRTCSTTPESVAWMACQFSSTGKGLTNLPEQLPKNALILLTDQLPPTEHDPMLVADQLLNVAKALEIYGVILDFQREHNPKCEQIASVITNRLPCPVIVTPAYQHIGNGPVLLPPVPLNCTLENHLKKYSSRACWLEMDPEGCEYILTEAGCTIQPLTKPLSEPIFYDSALRCHYHIQLSPRQAVFSLQRTEEDWKALLEDAKNMGVAQTIGLYQQFYLSEHRHNV